MPHTATPALSAAECAHAAIRSAIVRGEYAPGDMLSENDLAAALGVSRTPVRAALVRLQDENWITIYPKRGALVKPLGTQETREIADARHLLETGSVQRASDEARMRLAERLDSMITAQRQALGSSSFDQFISLSTNFHRAFVEVGGNSVLLDLYDRLRDRQSLMIAQSRETIAERADLIIAEHRELTRCARNGDWGTFSTTLRHHMLETHADQLGISRGTAQTTATTYEGP